MTDFMSLEQWLLLFTLSSVLMLQNVDNFYYLQESDMSKAARIFVK
ncbi:MAG: hypothetical protein K0R21_2099 [Anaerocolumna sp.]|nr:hypothetical protein [Anaerocolumna sp.]